MAVALLLAVAAGCRPAAATPTPAGAVAATVTPAPASASPTPAADSSELPARDAAALAERFKRLAGPAPRVVNSAPPQYAAGDQAAFWVGAQDAPNNLLVTATLRYITPHAYYWVEDGRPVAEDDLRRSAERFENQIYPMDRELFGSEPFPGVDNDPHINIFIGDVPGAAGYFYSANEYSRQVNPFSNEREVIFVNLEQRRPGTADFDATLAHELQHMIHWNNDANEEAWVNEGLSVLAQALNGFPQPGYVLSFLYQPDTQLTAWAMGKEPAGPHYGASYLLMTYFYDRFGRAALQELARSPLNGRAGFDAALRRAGAAEDFDALFADWVVANYLDDALLAGGRYGYRDLRLERPQPDRRYLTYPVSAESTVHQYGTDYIALAGNSPKPLTIEFAGQTSARLVATEAHSGRWMWWSNRGDLSDSTLTRAFDLRGVTSATLSAWMWYDIEPDWDYAYVAVSTDGGATWDALAGPHSVTDNPSGNSLGPAYTGKSGGGEQPAWIQERIDLSRYAGRQILLRFELVTDDAVNHPGLLIDDLSIPEIGYHDDFEISDPAWQAAGFARVENILPQRFVVQLIQFSAGGITVQRMALDGQNAGRLELDGLGSSVSEAVLAVSALAPATTEMARYRYSIR